MKFFAALLGLSAMAISADAGASMHNPDYCYTTDPIRPMTSLVPFLTSYEAIRRLNIPTVNPNASSTVLTK